MENKSAVIARSALAHEGRLAVFGMLIQAEKNGLAAGEIARTLGVLPNSLSANLNVLSNAGLVFSRRDGRSIIYSAQFGQITALMRYLIEDCCQGHPEICVSFATPCC